MALAVFFDLKLFLHSPLVSLVNFLAAQKQD